MAMMLFLIVDKIDSNKTDTPFRNLMSWQLCLAMVSLRAECVQMHGKITGVAIIVIMLEVLRCDIVVWRRNEEFVFIEADVVHMG